MRSTSVTCPMGGDISRNLSCVPFKTEQIALVFAWPTAGGVDIPLLATISSPDTMPPPNSYLCDTLPQAKLAQTTPAPRSPPSHGPVHTSAAFQSERPLTSDDLVTDPPEDTNPTPTTPQRKLCPRHKRMADEGTNLKLQQVRSARLLTCAQF